MSVKLGTPCRKSPKRPCKLTSPGVDSLDGRFKPLDSRTLVFDMGTADDGSVSGSPLSGHVAVLCKRRARTPAIRQFAQRIAFHP